MMTDELFQACEFAKTAADMSIPVEPMPTPEPGSEAIDGMVNGSMMDPNSVGAGTYAGAVDAAALAQAKARAAAAAQAAAAQKTAAIEEAYMMGYEDAVAEFEEMNKEASVEDAYVLGYEAAVEELEKMAGIGKMVEPVKETVSKYPKAKNALIAGAALAAGAGAKRAIYNRIAKAQQAKKVRRAAVGAAALGGVGAAAYAAKRARD